MGTASGFKQILIFVLLKSSGLKDMSQIALNSLGIQFFVRLLRSILMLKFLFVEI